MNKLNKEELYKINGGATNFFSAQFLNSIARIASVLLDIGRSIGSSIRRINSNNICP